MKTQFLQLSLGGTIDHTMVDVPADGGRWDASPAPTVALRSSSGGTIIASRSASQGPSLAALSTCAAGGWTLYVSSTTGLARWDTILIGPNSSGQWEWGIVDGYTTSTVTVLDALGYSYSTGDGVKSHTLSVTYSTSDVGAVYHNAVAEWSYTVDGVPRMEHTVCHVSRYAPRLSVTATDVLALVPRASEVIGSNQRIDLLLRTLWRQRILTDIAQMMRPGSMVSGEAANRALVELLSLEIATRARDTDGIDVYERRYRLALDEIRLSVSDMDEDGAQGDDEQPSSVWTVRLRRG